MERKDECLPERLREAFEEPIFDLTSAAAMLDSTISANDWRTATERELQDILSAAKEIQTMLEKLQA